MKLPDILRICRDPEDGKWCEAATFLDQLQPARHVQHGCESNYDLFSQIRHLFLSKFVKISSRKVVKTLPAALEMGGRGWASDYAID